MANETPEHESAAKRETEMEAAGLPKPMIDQTPEEPPKRTPPAEGEERPIESAEGPSEVANTEDAPAADLEPVAEGELPELTLGEGALPEEGLGEDFQPVIRGKIDRFGVAMGTGRRKTSVARVRIRDGNGQLTINGRTLDDYFATERDRKTVLAPLRATESEGTVDVWVRVNGGGTTGQAGAIVLGIARALQAKNSNLHHLLSEGGYLTRDGRMVERKKYGYKKARKSFQFSKR
ncbi:MAG: 30S ribosomal protein S9 [Planctomycetaceae bacterium]